MSFFKTLFLLILLSGIIFIRFLPTYQNRCFYKKELANEWHSEYNVFYLVTEVNGNRIWANKLICGERCLLLLSIPINVSELNNSKEVACEN